MVFLPLSGNQYLDGLFLMRMRRRCFVALFGKVVCVIEERYGTLDREKLQRNSMFRGDEICLNEQLITFCNCLRNMALVSKDWPAVLMWDYFTCRVVTILLPDMSLWLECTVLLSEADTSSHFEMTSLLLTAAEL